jgi:hypothetical protein
MTARDPTAVPMSTDMTPVPVYFFFIFVRDGIVFFSITNFVNSSKLLIRGSSLP